MRSIALLVFIAITLVFFSTGTNAWAADESDDRSASTTTKTRTRYESPLNAGLDIQYVPLNYKNYDWSGTTMGDIPNGNGVHIGLEWLPITRYGKLGLGVGSGFFWQKGAYFGRGRFANLQAIPIEAYVSYRFDYVKDQFLVPFLKIGPSATLLQQTGDVSRPGTQTYFGLDYSAGMEISLNTFDRTSAREFDHFIGVNNTYLQVEYLRSQYLDKHVGPNLTRSEFRVGLRFEM